MELFECGPLSARISRQQCEANRKRMFACESCDGLGGASTINEGEIMAERKKERPAYKVCSTPGCGRTVVRQRLCYRCLRAAGVDTETGGPLAVVDPPTSLLTPDPVFISPELCVEGRVAQLFPPPSEGYVELSSHTSDAMLSGRFDDVDDRLVGILNDMLCDVEYRVVMNMSGHSLAGQIARINAVAESLKMVAM